MVFLFLFSVRAGSNIGSSYFKGFPVAAKGAVGEWGGGLKLKITEIAYIV